MYKEYDDVDAKEPAAARVGAIRIVKLAAYFIRFERFGRFTARLRRARWLAVR